MSTYVMSDLHGRMDLFDEMIRQIDFKDSDTLYVLGDVVDRGGNLDLLLKLMQMPNVKMILGNHEYILLSLIQAVGTRAAKKEGMKRLRDNLNGLLMNRAMRNHVFVRAMNTLSNLKNQIDINDYKRIAAFNSFTDFSTCYTKDSLNNMTAAEIENVQKFLEGLHPKEEIDVDGRHFILVHAAYDYDKRNDLDYLFGAREEFYKHNVNFGVGRKGTVIFGHTTTRDIVVKTEHKLIMPYKIWFHDDKIGIDCAAAYPGGRLACLRLDDMQEFYVQNHNRLIVPIEYINDKMRNVQQYEKTIAEKHRKSYNKPIFSENRTI